MPQPHASQPPVLRFAPSPNGALHLGHALSALTGWSWAQRLGGRFLLRIEDIDVARTRESHVQGIFRDLAWLGIRWEAPVLRQSQRFADYADVAKRLAAMGLVYPCFATRAEISAAAAAEPAEFDPDGAPLYSGLHRHMPVAEFTRRKRAGEPFALRLDMTKALMAADHRLAGQPLTFTELAPDGCPCIILAHPERWGDLVIVRKDAPTSYHLAVVVDDARQNVTHVTRGRDLYAATDLHRLLQILLDLPEPHYHHHRLMVDADGRKLSKSARDTSLESLREAGATPADIRHIVGL